MATSNSDPVAPFRIYNYLPLQHNFGRIDRYGYPGDIDYKKGLDIRLPREDTFYKGFLIKTTYYAEFNYDTKVYGIPLVDVEANYVYTNGIIQYRDKHWYYYDENNNRYWVKGNDRKYYFTPTAQREAGRKRRQNVSDNIDLTVVGMLVITGTFNQEDAIDNGVAFLNKYRIEKSQFIADNTNEFYMAMQNDTDFSWLNTPVDQNGTTIRQWVMNEMVYEGEPLNVIV